jgi:hypothetical protein
MDIASMADLDHMYDQVIVFNRIDDAINSLPNTVAILSGKLLASTGSRVVGQGLDSVHHATAIDSVRNLLNFFHCRRLDQNSIFCHAASDP